MLINKFFYPSFADQRIDVIAFGRFGLPTPNKSNISTVLLDLQLDADVKVDIQNAVNAGKEVIVSKSNISFNGWSGCGYIIIDPATGDGAYMISGGLAGGVWSFEYIAWSALYYAAYGIFYAALFTFLIVLFALILDYIYVVGIALSFSYGLFLQYAPYIYAAYDVCQNSPDDVLMILCVIGLVWISS